MEKKYELLKDDSIVVGGHTLYRIKALRGTLYCEPNDIGGYIESEFNLSHEGSCWVANNAKVYGNSKITESACIDREAIVENSKISRASYITDHSYIVDSTINHSSIIGDSIIRNSVIMMTDVKYSNIISSMVRDCIIDNKVNIVNAYLNNCSLVESVVVNNSRVQSASIMGNAIINSNEDYIVFKNHFSSGRFFTWTRSNDKWTVGCFNGTGEELIEKAYKDSERKGKYYEAYVKLVEQFKALDGNN